MHSLPETAQVHYVNTSNPIPLTFHELYTPRESSLPELLEKREKSYWRTRDRIEYTIYQNITSKYICITCRNVESNEIYRSIFLNIEKLYYEIEAKARGDRAPLVRKKDKKFDKVTMPKQVVEYLLARLNIGQTPLPWPNFHSPAAPVAQSTTDNADEKISSDTPPSLESNPCIERMCTFDKLSSDEWENLEIPPPVGVSFEGIEFLKLQPNISPNDSCKPISSVPPSNNPIALTAIEQSTQSLSDKPTPEHSLDLSKPTSKSEKISATTTTTKALKKPSSRSGNKKKVVPIG